MVEVLDTWNEESGRANINDDVMDTFLFSGASDDGRITSLLIPNTILSVSLLGRAIITDIARTRTKLYPTKIAHPIQEP